MKSQLKVALAVFTVFFVVIQVIPGVSRTNPTSKTISVPPPAEIHQVLRRACYDCHSNETQWPAVSRIAPVAWAIESQVYAARSKMNFSFWPDDPDGQAVARRNIGRVIANHKMPLLSYWLVNENAKLTDAEIAMLEEWANAPSEKSPFKEAAIRGGRAAVVR